MLEEDEISDQQRSLIRLFENDLTDDNSGSEYFRDLQSSKDAFQQAAASIGVKHVSGWGLDSENATMINGVSMNKPMTVDHNGAIGAGSTTPLRNQNYARYRAI
jgi:hypothetical protein